MLSLTFVQIPGYGHLVPYHRFIATNCRPVLNDAEPSSFENLPISSFRPQNQFTAFTSLTPKFYKEFSQEPPVLSVITVTRNPRSVFLDTAQFLREQSLRKVTWIIINDHSSSVESYRMLQEVQRLDQRVVLKNNSRGPGFSNGRMTAIDYIHSVPTKYFLFLDDDDLFELTAFEKCVWMMESNTNISMCGFYVVGFGDRNYKWERGFHDGASAYLDKNPLTGSEMVRADVLNSTECIFDEKLTDGMEDWEFLLCLASRGHWGATIPEYLFWYRQNPTELRQERWPALFQKEEETIKHIRERYKSLETSFPDVNVQSSEVFEKLDMDVPFQNNLNLEKSMLFIIPWMAIGGADTANLNIVRELSRMGYRVTIVCTLLDIHGASMATKPLFMQYTHDMFFLPAFLRLSDVPRFLSYLIESRGVESVFISNSQLGYGLLPWLAAKYENVKFIDYVHNEEKEWKNGGYAAFSTVHRSSLDLTLTSSRAAKTFMVDNGHSESKVEVGYLGIDMEDMDPFVKKKKLALRKKLDIRPEAIVVIFIARMIAHKRPRVALEAFIRMVEREKELIKIGKQSNIKQFEMILIGDGPKLGEVQGIAKKADVQVKVIGSLEHTEVIEYLGVSDVFILPSLSEGISFAFAEAMALGVVPLVSNVGGFRELIGESGKNGVIVDISENDEEDTKLFAHKLFDLMTNKAKRDIQARKASLHVRTVFDASQRIPELAKKLVDISLQREKVNSKTLDMAPLYYTQQNILEELRVFSDFSEIQRSLRGKIRTAYGKRYRATCGEYTETMTKLIDYLENPVACSGFNITLDVESIQNFAIGQCGQWCVMNLGDSSQNSGWQISDGCTGIVPFNEEQHQCAKWYRKHKKVDEER